MGAGKRRGIGARLELPVMAAVFSDCATERDSFMNSGLRLVSRALWFLGIYVFFLFCFRVYLV